VKALIQKGMERIDNEGGNGERRRRGRNIGLSNRNVNSDAKRIRRAKEICEKSASSLINDDSKRIRKKKN
jgi:hypothetical protein